MATAVPDLPPRAIPELLRESAARYSPKVAIQMRRPDGTWQRHTYGELSDAAHGFAAGLLALGFEPGNQAAIILESSPEWAIGYLAVACAGGVVVPIYYQLAAEELAYILRESDCRLAIVSHRVLDRLPPRDAVPTLERLIVVEGPRGTEAEAAATSPWADAWVRFGEVSAGAATPTRPALPTVVPEQLLQILYTSGTTGNPKGAMLTHANVTVNVEQARRRVGVGAGDHILHVLPLHHVMTLFVGVPLPIAIGATVTYETDLRRVVDRMSEVHPTVFLGTPELYARILRRIFERAEAEGRGERLRKALHLVERAKQLTGINVGPLLFKSTMHKRLGGNMRFMVSGGAALSPEIARQYYNFGLLLIQGWGLTETSPVAAAQEVSRARFLFTRYYEEQLGTVGRAVEGMEARLIDVPDKQLFVQEHGEGELVLRGPNVMVGYYKNDAATREAFVGGVTEGPGRWYRTGDVGRIDERGDIYITGRAKDVVVLASGEKVYPDEVEAKLLESPLVEEVAVVGHVLGAGLIPGSGVPSPADLEQVPGSPRAAAEAVGRVQAWAVVFPNYEALQEQAQREGRPLTDDAAAEWVLTDLRGLQQDITPYKRVSEMVLTDTPLPKTAIRKVKRFEVARMLAAGRPGFSVDQLRASAEALAAELEPSPAPAAPAA